MHSLIFATWILAGAVPATPSVSQLSHPRAASGVTTSSPARHEPGLNSCAHVMEGAAWNTCDCDVDAFVYEDKVYHAPPYRLVRGKTRADIPAGMHRTVIFCRAGLHPISLTTGAFLERPEPHARCGTGTKS